MPNSDMFDEVTGPSFGVCCSPDDIEAVLAAGFDYVELGANRLVDDAVFRNLTDLRPPMCATNLFFPGDLRLYEDDWRPHARLVVERAARLGVATMVVGSGNARKSTPTTPPTQAEAAFIDIIAEINSWSLPMGVMIAPESLRRAETDVWNHLGPMATALRTKGVNYTADSYHVAWEWEHEGFDVTLESSGRFADLDRRMAEKIPFLPAHVHVGNAPRTVPTSDDPFMQAFARRLRDLGYVGCISLECTWTAEELPAALTALKTLFQ
ncbi:MAG: sugar phosphate isomerase/epimerase [Armatimonadetes bacterium]|nr:sugar phosphate isomerase/epimerase [Armatimonadota bacterium]